MRLIKSSNLNRGLVGAWCPSVAGNGLLLPDLSPYGNHGTLQNMDASDWVGTDKGRALDFDGTNDFIITPTAFALPPSGSSAQLTLSCWIYPRTETTQLYFSVGTSGGSFIYLGYRTDVLANGTLVGNLKRFVWNADGSQRVAYSNDHPTLNQWYHLCGRISTNSVSLYVDGIFQSFSVNSVSFNASQSRLMASATGTVPANAIADDFRAYNRALSPSEIKQLYEGGPGFGLRQERKRTRFQVQGFNAGRYRRQQLIGTGVY